MLKSSDSSEIPTRTLACLGLTLDVLLVPHPLVEGEPRLAEVVAHGVEAESVGLDLVGRGPRGDGLFPRVHPRRVLDDRQDRGEGEALIDVDALEQSS